MAVSGYQNPLEYQMYSAFENKEEEDTPVTTTSLTETQPVTTTTTTQQPVRSSLDILQSAGIQPTQKTAASDILKGVGVTSAKDVLRSMYFERPEGVLEREGISAASILEDYRKEQQAFRQRQNIASIAAKAEEDLRKKEQDFIKNYKYEIPQAKPVYETKFGKLDFSINAEEKPPSSPGFNTRHAFTDGKNNVATYAYLIASTDDKGMENEYVFVPESFALRGFKVDNVEGQNYRSLYNTGFLNKKAWEDLYTKAQAVDLSDIKINTGNYKANSESGTYGRGFLFDATSFERFYRDHLQYNFRDTYGFADDFANKTDIIGLGTYNGELVYVKDTFKEGRTTHYNLFINSTGDLSGQFFTEPKEHGGILGVVQDVGQFVAKIPGAPEIAFIASGGNPAVYASMKALQVSGSGGSPSDVLKAATVAYVTASVGQELSTYGDAAGVSIQAATGVPAAVATTMGHAVVNAGFNGFIAAATGQDIEDAMLTGAISGGLGANAADLTNAVFGGADNVKAISDTLNLNVKQTQRIFTGALSSGAINSVVKGGDFIDAFKESLIVQGVSQSGANLVGQKLTGSLSPKALNAIKDNTRIFLQATARAAVRGEDIETAIARVAPYLQGRAIGQTINIATSKKD